MARWRYLLRHEDFRADLNDLLKLRGSPDHFDQRRRALLDKWGVQLPYALRQPRTPDEVNLSNLAVFERLLTPLEAGLPVSRLDDYEELPWAVREVDLATIANETAPPGLIYEASQDQMTLCLAIRLDYPLDVLMALVEQEIRRAKEPVSPSRRRHDKDDFNLQVYDRAIQNEPFTKIARELGRPVTTVKTAFVRTRLKIYGEHSQSRKAVAGDALTADVDLQKHFATCSTCSKAKTSDNLCPPIRAHLGFVSDRPREKLVREIQALADVQAAPESFRARKRPRRSEDD
jgi:hypothetical protein